MNPIKIVKASLTHIHKIKSLKRNMYTCIAVNNTWNKLLQDLKKKSFSILQNLIPAWSFRSVGSKWHAAFSASN